MKHLHVVAAIIHNSQNQILATQRGYGEWKDYWEFPGGKIELGESHEAALLREMTEELETRILVEKFVTSVEYDYPKFHLTMHCYWCRIENGNLTLKEHEAARWLSKDELSSVNWLPADLNILDKIKQML